MRFDLKTPGRDTVAPIETVLAKGKTKADAFVAALGGSGNLISVDACTTRLRLVLVDTDVIDEAALKALGARGVIKPGEGALQVVLGPIADAVAGEIRIAAKNRAAAVKVDPTVIAALGGETNIVAQTSIGDRIRIAIADARYVDTAILNTANIRGHIFVDQTVLHILV